jgi:DNA-3-methyladenine glycosylase II
VRPRRPALPRLIETDDDVRAGVRALRRKCETMRLVHDMAGHPPLRRRPAGFEGMARIIVGQQLSVASAEAIWGRTAAACRPFAPATLLAADDATLLGAGLSRGKVRTLRALATACGDGLNLNRLAHASEEDVHTALTSIVGIGPWTADVYIMFCLGRADGWASGDLALQVAAQHALKLRERPDPVTLQEIA